MTKIDNFYCSNKFKYLKVDIEKGMTLNCHASTAQPINFTTLQHDSDELFNSEFMHMERHMMLNNKRTDTCHDNCWSLEEQGIESVRMRDGGMAKTHESTQQAPEILEIIVNTQCSLSCIYCCKEFSSAWRNDIIKGGTYQTDDTDRYTLSVTDLLLNKTPKKYKTARQDAIIDSITQYIKSPTLKRLQITGGEPLLDKNFYKFFTDVSNNVQVEIHTGLGISINMLERILNKLDTSLDIKFIVSAETMDKFYEFVRYGSKWEEFVEKINLIKHHGFDITLHSTLSNISVIDFSNFLTFFNEYDITHCFLAVPNYLAVNVLDTQTKDVINDSLCGTKWQNIIDAIAVEPTEYQREQCSRYIPEFANRRDMDLDLLPKSFKSWLRLN
jgi:molybdenum cofactor biosynthesis enzyme MoaA